MKLASLVLFLVFPLSAQQLVLTVSQASGYQLQATVWNAAVCNPGSQSVTLPQLRVFQAMAEHGLAPLTNAQALAALTAAPGKSAAAKVAQWTGYGAALAAFLTTADVVKARPSIQAALAAAAGGLNVIAPLAQRNVSTAALDLAGQLGGAFLSVPPAGCASTVALGGPGAGFQIFLKE
jgi:hypothetical protein